MKPRWTNFPLAILRLAAASAFAEEPPVKTEVVLTGLTNPCGVAIQPSTGAVFVSDTGAGANRQVLSGRTQQKYAGRHRFSASQRREPQRTNLQRRAAGPGFLSQNMLIAGEGR